MLPAAAALGLVAQVPEIGRTLPVLSVAPFVALLLSIAVFPLVAPHWWERHRNKALVTALVAVPFAVWAVRTHGDRGWNALEHSLLDYVSFLALLGALYVIAGGVYVRGSLAGSPLSNTCLLAIGAVLANLVGTTGASMILIRPLLRAVRTRQRKAHVVVFFIFVVSNCGGLLTPFADPPLYLGFLRGVPFGWTLGLWPEWLAVNGILLIVFFAVDSHVLDREELDRPGSQLEEALKHEPIGVAGARNLLLLAGVVLAILGKARGWGSGGEPWGFGVQEGLLAALALTSWLWTPRDLHAANRFTFGPINEVAILFAGIFVTMTAPLLILNARADELGVTSPWQFYWVTGGLSGFLDNAPTYLTMAAVAAGQAGVPVTASDYLSRYLASGPEAHAILAAIACGAVMMGANTYIGNGPNFMVKAIAEEEGVRMPSFFGYMGWSAVVLLPTFVGVTLLFFR